MQCTACGFIFSSCCCEKKSIESSNDEIASNWTKHKSKTHNRDYWFNDKTNEKTWIEPTEQKESVTAFDLKRQALLYC